MTKKKPAARRRNHNPKGRSSGNVTTGPVVTKKIRVPINRVEYHEKESALAQVSVAIAKVQKKIAPDLIDIRKKRKEMAGLTRDIEENTELRDTSVRETFHWNTNEVVVNHAKTGEQLERRTMTTEERKRQEDIEDVGRAGKLAAEEDDAEGGTGGDVEEVEDEAEEETVAEEETAL